MIIKIFLILLYIFFFILIPGYVLLLKFRKYKWLDNYEFPLVLAVGLTHNIISSALYRSIAGKIHISISYYYILHLFFILSLSLYIYNNRQTVLQRIKLFMSKVKILDKDLMKQIFSYIIVFIFLLTMVYKFSVLPYHKYHTDQLHRMSIAHFIKLGYPPPEFHVYSDRTYKYYNFTELITANISQFTNIEIRWIYFRFMLFFNWSIIFLAFIGILNSQKPKYYFFKSFLFIFFILIQGPGSAQKISHFLFRQNTFALGFLLLSCYSIFLFFKTDKYFYYLSSIIVGSLVIGMKLIAFSVLIPIIPIAGIYALVKNKINLKKIIIGGILALILCSTWYLWLIHNPAPGARPSLHFNVSHCWMQTYSTWLQYYPYDKHNYTNFIFIILKKSFNKLNISMDFLLVPVFALFEYIIFVLLGIIFNNEAEKRAFNRKMLVFYSGAISSILIFCCFELTISVSAIIYFLFFGSWAFQVFSSCFLIQSVSKKNHKYIMFIVILLFFMSLNNYSIKMWSVNYPKSRLFAYKLCNHYKFTQQELRAFEVLKENTDPDSYILHNYYRTNQLWSFAALTARKAVITSHYEGAVNQDHKLYRKIALEADKFFNGEYSQDEIGELLKKYEVQAVFWVKKINSPRVKLIKNFKKILENDEIIIWRQDN